MHGWIYGLHDGRLQDLGFCAAADETAAVYEAAVGMRSGQLAQTP